MAPPTEPPTHITLRIKVPPGHIEGDTDTFALPNTLAVTTKIGEVRDLICATLPTNPPPERQRLLYFGRALVDNDQSVAEALNIRRDPSQTEYVIHLLVRGVSNAAPAPRTATPPGQVVPQHGLAENFRQHQQQLLQRTMPHEHPHGAPEQSQVEREIQLAHALHQRAQLEAELRRAEAQLHQARLRLAQLQILDPRVPGVAAPHVQPNGERIATPPNVSSQQPPSSAPSHQAPPNAPPHQAQPNAPPLAGQPLTHNFFMQGVGPNGERIAVHHQHRVFQHTIPLPNNLPHAGGLTAPFGMQNPQQPQSDSPSALGRAREQLAELRRLLEEFRAENPPDEATPEQNARMARMEEQARNINNYIDPLVLASAGDNHADSSADPTQRPPRTLPSQFAFNQRWHANDENNFPPGGRYSTTRRQGIPRSFRVPPPADPAAVTCYLLSDPTGLPQALLLTPEHGTFTGILRNRSNANVDSQAPLQQPAAPPHEAIGPAQVVQVRRVPANGDAAPINPMELLLRHFWLLLRIMIFSYFLLGSNMGWRRPLALGAIALGFWLIRAGILGDGGVVRGWWEEIVREGAAAVEPVRPAGAMPTPEEVARRLMEERRRGEGEWVRWGRERVRAVVLLLASLWPGVGEAFVRAREAEERRLAEEEVARAAAQEAENTERRANAATDVAGEQAAIKNKAVAETPEVPGEVTDSTAVAEKSSEAGPSSSSPS